MTDEQPPSSGATPTNDKERRKPPTIELKATEIEDGAADPVDQAAIAGEQLGGRPQKSQPEDALGDRTQRSPRGRGTWTALAAGAAGGATIALLFLAADM